VGMLIRPQDGKASSAATGQYDPLTGLANRSMLMSRLSTLLAGERSADERFAVLFIDLDNFKSVNDLHGHLAGDRVLCEAARRLERTTREVDQVFRYGGDEFVVVVEQVENWEEFEPVIARIHAALADPIAIPGGTIELSASVGVAEAMADFRTPDDLIAAADRSMYAAKRRTASKALR
jgi:diguanylate cyclase